MPQFFFTPFADTIGIAWTGDGRPDKQTPEEEFMGALHQLRSPPHTNTGW